MDLRQNLNFEHGDVNFVKNYNSLSLWKLKNKPLSRPDACGNHIQLTTFRTPLFMEHYDFFIYEIIVLRCAYSSSVREKSNL